MGLVYLSQPARSSGDLPLRGLSVRLAWSEIRGTVGVSLLGHCHDHMWHCQRNESIYR